MDSPITSRVPRGDELMNSTLGAIRALGGSASIEEIENKATDDMALPSQVTDIPHGDGRTTELKYRLAWARTSLKKNGLIDNSQRGVWSLTPKGRDAAHIDPDEVTRTVVQRAKAERQRRADEGGLDREDSALGEDDLDGEAKVLVDDSAETASWREGLLKTLQDMAPEAFERLCQRLLRESGFIEVEVTGKSGDGGIDGHGIIRLAGFISFPVLFQCKRHKGSVGPSVVRDFRGAMIGRADRGVILTTGTFTRDAQREATRDGAPPIDLMDGELLIDRLKEAKLGVSTRMVEEVEIDYTFFESV